MLGRRRAEGASRVRALGLPERVAALELCGRDPVGSVLAAVQVEQLAQPVLPGTELLGVYRDGALRALCWAGANLVPVGLTHPDDVAEVAAHLRARGRRCSSVVGPAEQVLPLWERLAPAWSRPREIRPDQPSMAITDDPAVRPDPHVRQGRVDELDIIVPACVAMFTEEVGYSPVSPGGGYEARVHELVATGRSYVRVEQGRRGPRVVFKAEVGALAQGVAQVQGVWVHPELRGQGLATAGMAAVVADARARLAPTVSLYVNAYNGPALATYRRTGFTQVGTYATVLF